MARGNTSFVRGSGASLWPWLAWAVVILLADQFTKTLILGYYRLGDATTITSFFNIVRAHNTGAAFSFLADHGGWQRWLFVGIGAGLIVRRGGASGGDDALALILHQVTGWKISRSYFFTDFVVLMLSISYIPLRNIFFSLLTVTLSSAVIELLQKSGQKATAEESGRESSWKD